MNQNLIPLQLQLFYDKLDRHDWFYHNTDDQKVYDRAEKNEMVLHNQAALLGPEFLDLLDQFKIYRRLNATIPRPTRPGGPRPKSPEPDFL